MTLDKNYFTDLMESNETAAKQYLNDPQYGLVPEKPIYTCMPEGSREYLSGLVTLRGEPLRWERRGSANVKGINGVIDVYEGYLPTGELYQTLFVNMYSFRNSSTIPHGFLSKGGPVPREESPVTEEIQNRKKSITWPLILAVISFLICLPFGAVSLMCVGKMWKSATVEVQDLYAKRAIVWAIIAIAVGVLYWTGRFAFR